MVDLNSAAGEPASSYLSSLNPAQRSAVEALDGPVLVLAGAGTGKTRVLTTRLAHLLLSRRIDPRQVLAVTFTNKAAQEMRHRVAALLGQEVEGWWLGTFHALAARILRRHAELVGLRSDFTILDSDDQLRLIRQLLQAAKIDDHKWPPRAVLGVIERWKDRGLVPAKLAEGDGGEVAGGRAVELFIAYQARLKTLNACDFGDLLVHNLTIFQDHPDVLAQYHRQFQYLLVDEYQDTNVSQYLWLRILAQGHKNICCVGDDDQSIYGWRGAEVGNILRFEHDFPGAKVIRLEQNYRSTGHILAAAAQLVANNRGRLGKTLWTQADGGEPVRVKAVWDADDEARWVSDEIEALQRSGTALGEIAILVRAGFQTREFEERFLNIGLPYRVLGGPRFYERQEIRDAMAYVRVTVQPDDDLAFERIINLPKRGIGPAALQQLSQAARRLETSRVGAALRLVETDELKPKLRATLRALLQDFARWREQFRALPHTEVVPMILDESGYTRMWQEDKSPEAPGRLENLKELVNAMAEFDAITGFLEHVSLVMENVEGAGDAAVSVMTLHGAKGLEFDNVFLPGWEEGLFPNQRALDGAGVAGLEEERRLAYVGLTRARLRAYVSHAANRMIHGSWTNAMPSRFVAELPDEDIVSDAAPGLFATPSRGLATGVGRFAAGETGRDGGRTAIVEARAVPSRDRSPERGHAVAAFGVGERVFHTKFGYGTIETVDGDKLHIAFDIAGSKKVIDSFVVPADQAS
ncbi:MAG: UvrD-helicase domain-containing protein [Azospirillaceae bacterium]|nr:UvrD-helicase domain-containing protein [Azospirillaceae bacterium]